MIIHVKSSAPRDVIQSSGDLEVPKIYAQKHVRSDSQPGEVQNVLLPPEIGWAFFPMQASGQTVYQLFQLGLAVPLTYLNVYYGVIGLVILTAYFGRPQKVLPVTEYNLLMPLACCYCTVFTLLLLLINHAGKLSATTAVRF